MAFSTRNRRNSLDCQANQRIRATTTRSNARGSTMTTHKEALEAAYLAGFNASGEGYNGEYPFGDKKQDPAENPAWRKDCDNYIKEALAQPEQERCVGCEACIDTACGRDECPKGWPKAAQPEQEPVAWMNDSTPSGIFARHIDGARNFGCTIPLYTTPPQRKPLTDEMVLAGARALAKRHADSCGLDFDDVWKYYAEEHKIDAKAVIEAAHGIKEQK